MLDIGIRRCLLQSPACKRRRNGGAARALRAARAKAEEAL